MVQKINKKNFVGKKLITLGVLGLLSSKVVFGAYNRVAENVVRVELTKQWIPRHEITELEESDKADMEIQIYESNYQRLRETQKNFIDQSFKNADRIHKNSKPKSKQRSSTMLAQSSSGESTDQTVGSKSPPEHAENVQTGI